MNRASRAWTSALIGSALPLFLLGRGTPILPTATPSSSPTPSARSAPTNAAPRRAKLGDAELEIGIAAYTAKWSNYGAYLARMVERVNGEWDRAVRSSDHSPVAGTQVLVKFKIDKRGRIAEIVDVQGTAGDPWKKLSTSALTRGAPYGEWTDEMIALLGESQEMIFVFFLP